MIAKIGVCNILVDVLIITHEEICSESIVQFINHIKKLPIPKVSYMICEKSIQRLKLSFQLYTFNDLPEVIKNLESVIEAAATNILTPKKLKSHALS